MRFSQASMAMWPAEPPDEIATKNFFGSFATAAMVAA